MIPDMKDKGKLFTVTDTDNGSAFNGRLLDVLEADQIVDDGILSMYFGRENVREARKIYSAYPRAIFVQRHATDTDRFMIRMCPIKQGMTFEIRG